MNGPKVLAAAGWQPAQGLSGQHNLPNSQLNHRTANLLTQLARLASIRAPPLPPPSRSLQQNSTSVTVDQSVRPAALFDTNGLTVLSRACCLLQAEEEEKTSEAVSARGTGLGWAGWLGFHVGSAGWPVRGYW